MYKQETASDLAIRICERLGIHYHLGDGVSTVDGEPYDFNDDPFDIDIYSATLQIALELAADYGATVYDNMVTQNTGVTTIYSSVKSTSYQFSVNNAEPLTAA